MSMRKDLKNAEQGDQTPFPILKLMNKRKSSCFLLLPTPHPAKKNLFDTESPKDLRKFVTSLDSRTATGSSGPKSAPGGPSQTHCPEPEGCTGERATPSHKMPGRAQQKCFMEQIAHWIPAPIWGMGWLRGAGGERGRDGNSTCRNIPIAPKVTLRQTVKGWQEGAISASPSTLTPGHRSSPESVTRRRVAVVGNTTHQC